MKSSIWIVGCVCYASSHDDIIGIFDEEPSAKAACDKLNQDFINDPEYGESRKSTVEAWGECYYFYEVDVSEFDGHKYTGHPGFKEWLVVYGVPSLGEFKFFPVECTSVTKIKVNSTESEELNI